MLALTLAILSTGLIATTAHAYTEGFWRGYNDGQRDHTGKGWDPTCPGGHGAVFCQNYLEGYRSGWAAAGGTFQQVGPSTSTTQSQLQQQQQSQSQGNTIIIQR